MYLSFLFVITFYSISVRCQHFLVAHQRFEPGKCMQTSLELMKVMQQVSCKPRDTLVELVPESPHFIMYPQRVEVKRCEGVCHGLSTCNPIGKQEVPIPVLKYDFMSKRKSCGILYVEEHTACNCGCNISAEQCNDRQEYIPDQCRCVCKPNAYKTCIQENMIWNPKTCTCECIYQNHCSNEMEWIPSLCRCARVL